jgi:hypothetical protein
MSGSEPRLSRSLASDSTMGSRNRSPSPPSPTMTYHANLVTIPTPALVESVAGAAHYSGARLDHETHKRRRSSHGTGDRHTELKPSHQRVLDDLNELFGCRPTLEIFERSWSKDAVFEVIRAWVPQGTRTCAEHIFFNA